MTADRVAGGERAPRLSVVVPAKDVVVWIDDALASIVSQSVDDMEVIVVDDGSTDGTLERALDFAQLDPRVTVLRGPGVGGGTARNVGVSHARGTYLMFADADDIVPAHAYRSLVAMMDQSQAPVGVARHLKFSAIDTWDPTARWPAFSSTELDIPLKRHPSIIRSRACWNKIFRRDFWLEHELSFPDVARSNDIWPMTRAMLLAPKVSMTDRVAYLYRERPGGQSMTAQSGKIAGLLSYLEQELRCFELVEQLAPHAVRVEYESMLVSSDLWVHLVGALSDGDPASLEPHALEQVRASVSALVGRMVFRGGGQRRNLIELAAQGHLDVFEGLNRQGHVERYSDAPSPDHARRVIDTALALARRRAGLARLAAEYLEQRLLVPLISPSLPNDASDVATISQLLVDFHTDPRSRAITKALHFEGRAILQAAQPRGIGLEAARDEAALPPALGALRPRGRDSWTLKLKAALPPRAKRVMVVAEHSELADHSVLRTIPRLGDGSFNGELEVEISTATLRRPGPWSLSLIIDGDRGESWRPVLAEGRAPQAPEGKLSRVVVLESPRQGSVVTLFVRPTLAKRAWLLLRRSLQRR